MTAIALSIFHPDRSPIQIEARYPYPIRLIRLIRIIFLSIPKLGALRSHLDKGRRGKNPCARGPSEGFIR